MFARICLADGFIHGIGGAKYDEVTDAIVGRWLGLEAPRFIVFTATFRLPLPRFPTSGKELHAVRRKVRDLNWKPQQYLSGEDLANVEVRRLVEEKQRLIGEEPRGKVERKAWFRRLSELTEKMRPCVAGRIADTLRELKRRESEARANDLLMRRDYPWCLFPEEMLKEFCQRLM
jgi:hypothetical protein